MPLTDKQYRDLGEHLDEVFTAAPSDDNLHVGRAAVKSVWKIVEEAMTRHWPDTPWTRNFTQTMREDLLPAEDRVPTLEEHIGDVLRKYRVGVADPDGLAAELAAGLAALVKKEDDDEDDDED